MGTTIGRSTFCPPSWRGLGVCVCLVLLLCRSTSLGADSYLQSVTPIGHYVGMFYGLVNPSNDQWYEGQDLSGYISSAKL